MISAGVDRRITVWDPSSRTIEGETINITGQVPRPNPWPWLVAVVAIAGAWWVARRENERRPLAGGGA